MITVSLPQLLRAKLALTVTVTALVAVNPTFAVTALVLERWNLYEIDLRAGTYEIAAAVPHLTAFASVTLHEGVLYGASHYEHVGVVVYALDRSSLAIHWERTFPELDFAHGIAFADGSLFLVATRHEAEIRHVELVTLDHASGEEVARVELFFNWGVVYALAGRGDELWLVVPPTVPFEGILAERLDPVTGVSLESVGIPDLGSAVEAEFAPDGSLWLSQWTPDAIGLTWCTHYYQVELGSPAEERWTHCWPGPPAPMPPVLSNFALAGGESCVRQVLQIRAVVLVVEPLRR